MLKLLKRFFTVDPADAEEHSYMPIETSTKPAFRGCVDDFYGMSSRESGSPVASPSHSMYFIYNKE